MVKETAARKIEQKNIQAGQLEIIFYTDPLCCWSWAIEPQIRRLKYEFAGQLNWRYCMAGLLPGWKNYHDEINSVSRPIQMGPVWLHAQQLSGMPMASSIWMKDPPASSYLSCIAVKCAALQSSPAEEKYLRLLREALMLKEKNIDKQSTLMEIASELIKDPYLNFDIQQFEADLNNDNGLEAFRKDLQEIQYRHINRFPTLVMKSTWHQGLVLTGYRPYPALLESLREVAPFMQKNNPSINEIEYRKFWGTLTKREEEEIEMDK